MSDRRRRWICQFFFIAVCVLPTAWVLLRIANRPSNLYFAQQLQLHLGVPVTVGSVSTPTPDFTWLHDVRVQHPETGVWAVADRIAMLQSSSGSGRPSWQIDRLVVRESTLSDFFAQLHDTIVRQRLNTDSGSKLGSEQSVPLVHVRNLVVVPGETVLLDVETTLAAVVNLRDVLIDWRAGEKHGAPRLELAAKMVPLRQGSEILAVDASRGEVPIVGTLERLPLRDSSVSDSAYVTRWEVAVLERPLPVAWINASSWPEFVRERPGLEFTGLIGGNLYRDRWELGCRSARVRGWDMSDIEYLASGQRRYLQADVQVNIQHLAWSGVPGGATKWDACDVELNAGNGEVDARWVEMTCKALGLHPETGAIQPVSHDAISDDSGPLRFDQLNLGLRWHEGRWWFRPLDAEQGPLPVLRGYNSQDQIDWPKRDERAWSAVASNHEAARVDFAVGANELEPSQREPSQRESTHREPLQVAPSEFSWQPTELIQGDSRSDRFIVH